MRLFIHWCNKLADPLIYPFYKSDYRRAFKNFFVDANIETKAS